MKTLDLTARRWIVAEVARATGFAPREFRSASGRTADALSWARAMATTLCREHLAASTAVVGRWFGLNHSTVIYSEQRVRDSFVLPDNLSRARARLYFRLSTTIQRRLELLETQ